MANSLFVAYLFFAYITVIHCYQLCQTYSSGMYNSKYEYCSYGCCGSGRNRHCCSENVGKIVGIVIGCLAFAAVVVCVIVAICCCRRRRSRTGQVLTTTSGTTVVTGVHQPGVIYQTQTVMPGTYPVYGQPPPMGYTQQSYPPAVSPQPMQQATPYSAPAYEELKHHEQPPTYESIR